MRELESKGAALVECGYYPDVGPEKETVKFLVPASLLWSSEGLAYLFKSLRRSYLPSPESPNHEVDVWESWHIVSMREQTEYNVVSGLLDTPRSNKKKKAGTP